MEHGRGHRAIYDSKAGLREMQARPVQEVQDMTNFRSIWRARDLDYSNHVDFANIIIRLGKEFIVTTVFTETELEVGKHANTLPLAVRDHWKDEQDT